METQERQHDREKSAPNVGVEPYFTTGISPFSTVSWEPRSASITNPQTGETVFHAEDLAFPINWSQNTVGLVAEKYFRHVETEDGSLKRETGVREMISRVAGTIARWGVELGYFPDVPANGTPSPVTVFRNELSYILLHQMAAFNSPVWFNVGTKRGRLREEQASACFIQSLDDTMESILALGDKEGRLYKGGSGSGVNYSNLRSSRERLSGGGHASGPVPFIAKDDANAGAIKSGGTTRRAAKMNILDADHGDILEFIRCKADGERAAHALIDAGFEGDFRARWGAYGMVPFQNANHSVRVTDRFMAAVENDEPWQLMRRDGSVLEHVRARDIWDEVCKAAHFCGDPGLQFDSTINNWHTCRTDGRISASNPCSEYMFLDDTACNLASINLLKFLNEDGSFALEDFTHTVDVLITAMEILVDGASYPTPEIQERSTRYRTLGLGWTNLGAFLMAQGIPYDSDEGRTQAGLITALMTGRAYRRSAAIAAEVGPFPGYEDNHDKMDAVINKHRLAADEAAGHVDGRFGAETRLRYLGVAAVEAWEEAQALGRRVGYRNAQTSVIAPAGTISFLMDCDTTSIEPDLSLTKVKKLVGGGTITMANQQIGSALRRLGYDDDVITAAKNYAAERGSLAGSGLIKDEHLPVFDTAFPDPVKGRKIRPEAAVLMMAAVQPFISGAISKTVNLSADATPEDVGRIYRLAWECGLKAIAIYRDGSKRTQPLSTQASTVIESETSPEPLQVRRKLPNDCVSHRHKFSIGGHEGYIHVGLYEDGKPGEVFVKMSKEGSTVSGLMDGVAVLTSIAIQHGVPLELLVEKFSFTAFEPAGITGHPSVRFAKSPLDYLFRWLGAEFLEKREPEEASDADAIVPPPAADDSGLVCGACGNPAQRAGACVTCPTCGWNEGCG